MYVDLRVCVYARWDATFFGHCLDVCFCALFTREHVRLFLSAHS
jgi:hypothetical protein